MNAATDPTAIYFGSVTVLIVAAFVVAWIVRRRDHDRISDNNERLGMRCSDDIETTEIWARITAGSADGQVVDPMAMFGAGNVLTRSRVTETHKVKSAQVNDDVIAGRCPGVAAVLKVSSTTKSSGFASSKSTTTSEDVVVARLPRQIDGHLHGTPITPAPYDPDNFEQLDEVFEAGGLKQGRIFAALKEAAAPFGNLDDPDLRHCFVAHTPAKQLLVEDEVLRALIWAVRPVADGYPTSPATDRYEQTIEPMPVKGLREVTVDGDLLILRGSGSPFRSTADQRLVELADHLARSFR